jgi:hypothetical protein
METYEIVGIADLLGDPENPYLFQREIGPCSENDAIAEAYRIVSTDETLGVKEYRLLKKSWKARDVAGGISVHRLNVPVCDDCWKKLSETAQTHYWNKPAELQRCGFCGCGTANGLFARFDKAKFPSL